jgi:Tfp pilus assembly protein FimV
VLATFVILVVAATVTAVWMVAAGGAAASSQGMPSRSPYSGMTQVVVRPGQTVWSVAVAADPSANPWTVVQQIAAVNSLTGTNIQAGQLLWVPVTDTHGS